MPGRHRGLCPGGPRGAGEGERPLQALPAGLPGGRRWRGATCASVFAAVAGAETGPPSVLAPAEAAARPSRALRSFSEGGVVAEGPPRRGWPRARRVPPPRWREPGVGAAGAVQQPSLLTGAGPGSPSQLHGCFLTYPDQNDLHTSSKFLLSLVI